MRTTQYSKHDILRLKIYFFLLLITTLLHSLYVFPNFNTIILGFSGLTIFIFLFFSIKNYLINTRIGFLILLITMYFSINLMLSSKDIYESSIRLMGILIAFFCYLFGRFVYKKGDIQENITKYYVNYSLKIIVISLVIYSVFKIGNQQYGTSSILYIGYWGTTNFYIIPYLILATLYYVYWNRKMKITFFSVILLISAIIVIINLNRTSILLMLFTLLSFLYFQKTSANRLFFFTLALLFVLIFLSPIIKKQFSIRKDIFNDKYGLDYKRETRYYETQYLLKKITNADLYYKLFGFDALPSNPKYGSHSNFNNRQIHVDPNIIIYSFGYIGLLLYVVLLMSIFFDSYKRLETDRDRFLFYNLLFTVILTSLVGGIYSSPRLFLFFLLGVSSTNSIEDKVKRDK